MLEVSDAIPPTGTLPMAATRAIRKLIGSGTPVYWAHRETGSRNICYTLLSGEGSKNENI